MAGAKDLICLQKRVKSVDIEAQRSSVCQEKDWREKSRDRDGDCCPGLRAMDMMSAPCCDGANGLSVSFASSVFSHCPYWRRRGQPIFSSQHEVSLCRSLGFYPWAFIPFSWSLVDPHQRPMVWWSQHYKTATTVSHGLTDAMPGQRSTRVSPARVPMGETHGHDPWAGHCLVGACWQ